MSADLVHGTILSAVVQSIVASLPERNVNCLRPFARFEAEQDMNVQRVAVGLVFASLTGAVSAQEVGRPQDGFYSGQSNNQYSGQTSGQANSRVDGRANRNEGVPPTAGDVNKHIQAAPDRSPPTNAETMDAVVRPGVQR